MLAGLGGEQHDGGSDGQPFKAPLAIRPALPLTLLPVVTAWVGILLAEAICWNLPTPLSRVWPALCLAGGLAFLPFCLRKMAEKRRKPLIVGLAAMCLLLALASGLFFWTGLKEAGAELAAGQPDRFGLLVTSDPDSGQYSAQSTATLSAPGYARAAVRVFWPADAPAAPLGSSLEGEGRVRPLQEHQEFLFQKGIAASYALSGVSDQHFKADPYGALGRFRADNANALSELDDDSSQLLRGVLLGQNGDIYSSGLGLDFRSTGLMHLIAVSGSHLAVIASLLTWILRRLGLRRLPQFVVLTAVLLLYVVLTAVQPSAIRATLMVLAAQGAWLGSRRSHAPSALGLAALVMLLVYPPTAFSLGFWLSVLAVVSLTVFLPLARSWVQGLVTGLTNRFLPQKAQSAIAEPLAMTVCAQAGTMPLSLPVFATLPLVSPLANIVVAPLVSLQLLIGLPSLLVGLFSPGLRAFLLQVVGLVASLSCQLTSLLAKLPLACLPFDCQLAWALAIGALAAILLYAFWPTFSKRSAAVLLLVLLAVLAYGGGRALLPAPPELVVMDVGQGDALLLREGKTTLLLDAGPDKTALLKALARNGVFSIDAVILSHLDSDHVAGLVGLEGIMRPHELFLPRGMAENETENKMLKQTLALFDGRSPSELLSGDQIVLGNTLCLSVLLPDNPVDGSSNENCLVASLDYDANGDGACEARVLLTGDAESETLAQISDSEAAGGFIALKIGHHGSSGGVTVQQLADWGCQLVLISVGRDNKFGHPTAETLAVLEQSGVDVLRTDLDGDISLHFTKHGIEASCATMRDFND